MHSGENFSQFFLKLSIIHFNYCITRITKDEFAGLAVELVQNATLLKQLDGDFEKYAPICFFLRKRNRKIQRH
jgi:hypothetical protein